MKNLLLTSVIFFLGLFTFASSAFAGPTCGWCGTANDCPGGFAGSGAGYCQSGTSCCSGWNPGTSSGGSSGGSGGSGGNTCQSGNTYCKGKTYGTYLSTGPSTGCYCNSVSGSDCACQPGGPSTKEATPKPSTGGGSGGSGGTGQINCPVNQVCNGVQSCFTCPNGGSNCAVTAMVKTYDLSKCVGGKTTESYIIACDCNGDGKAETQRTTYTISGNGAAAYCSGTVCPGVGSTMSNGKTKICEPGITVSCNSMGAAGSPGMGVVCNSDGLTTSVVRSDACINSTINNYTTNPAGCSKSFVGCSGDKNCYSCGSGKAPYCVYEPGLSCGAKGTTATPAPTTTSSNPPGTTPPSSNPPFVCLRVSKDIDTPTFGQSVRFTCGTVTGVTRYEFQYKVGTTVGTIPTLNATSNLTQPFAITQAGSYKVQCRPCKNNNCTAWSENFSTTTP